jgi:23S rRNA (cytosine1962-C5)-methyltransferase
LSGTPQGIIRQLAPALDARAELFDGRHEAAFRLFNGFTEGAPDLAIDLYASTLVLHNYADPPERAQATVAEAQAYLLERLPWLRAAIVKPRRARAPEERRGRLTHGESPDRRARENGVWYALDLLLNRDASLYLDTRALRAWAKEHLVGRTVLNAFAYTGSLGVAARAGGAKRVVHLDRNRAFLNVAKASYTLNGLPIDKADFRAGDVWMQASQLRRANAQFDCVFLDPPFFSETSKGTVDLVDESRRVINKVRPLVADGGVLVAINNALFAGGAEYVRTLEELASDGYMAIESLVPVPPDFTGYPATRVSDPPVDPAPFNHPTKIAILRVRRKGAGA